jgi:hypothetical protein
MREFKDERGETWLASVLEREGEDYKGRFFFRLSPKDGAQEPCILLRDVTWNSSKTAERTLNTMSEVELRRRLKIGLGRAG